MERQVVIIEDDRQHEGKHTNKHEVWDALGVPYLSRDEMIKLDFGDYMRGFDDGTLDESVNISVDTKRGLSEISMNLGRKHDVFKREVKRANERGYLLVVVIETTEAGTIDDVMSWINEHCRHCSHFYGKRCEPTDRDEICIRHGTKKPLQGETIAKQMTTMQIHRGVRFEFVKPEDSAKRICELLGVTYERNDEQPIS
jgi:hypothetical protein